MAGFVELIAWREAAALAASVDIAAQGVRGVAAPVVAEQLVRCANSIHANVAEGHGRGVTADCTRFLRIAKASADELESHLRVARLAGRLDELQADGLIDHSRRVGYLILRLMESVERRRRREPDFPDPPTLPPSNLPTSTLTHTPPSNPPRI